MVYLVPAGPHQLGPVIATEPVVVVHSAGVPSFFYCLPGLGGQAVPHESSSLVLGVETASAAPDRVPVVVPADYRVNVVLASPNRRAVNKNASVCRAVHLRQLAHVRPCVSRNGIFVPVVLVVGVTRAGEIVKRVVSVPDKLRAVPCPQLRRCATPWDGGAEFHPTTLFRPSGEVESSTVA